MSLILERFYSKGDTLIEVLFGITIFSLIAVGGLSIMNQGLTSAQRTLEITIVRNEIDAQAEALRFLNASFVSVYQPGLASYDATTPAGKWFYDIRSKVTNDPSASDLSVGMTCPEFSSLENGSFILNNNNADVIELTNANFNLASTFAGIEYDASDQIQSSNGLWIEPVITNPGTDASQSNIRYIDFHIRACWESPGQSVPLTLGTIVRLYEPI